MSARCMRVGINPTPTGVQANNLSTRLLNIGYDSERVRFTDTMIEKR